MLDYTSLPRCLGRKGKPLPHFSGWRDDMNDIKITLTDLSVNDVNLIMAGLGKLPLEAVVDLWSRIKVQGEAQIKQEPAGLTD